MAIELYTQVALKEDLPEYGLKKGDVAMVIEHYPMPEGTEDGYSLEGFAELPPAFMQGVVQEPILQQGEVKKLINAASPGRDRSVLTLIYSTGLRASEALGIDWFDLKPLS